MLGSHPCLRIWRLLLLFALPVSVVILGLRSDYHGGYDCAGCFFECHHMIEISSTG